MDTDTLLVYGWYGRSNSGDELMKHALEQLFEPRGVHLKFVDELKVNDVSGSSGVLFGGGSILWAAPHAQPGALRLLQSGSRPAFYVGVGGETTHHPVHSQLMSGSSVVVFRDRDMPDLAYSLQPPTVDKSNPVRDEILFIPNIEVVPTYADPHWMHLSWARFKDEIAQTLDLIIDTYGIHPTFLLMCHNDRMDDAWPAYEIIASLKRRPPVPKLVRAPTDTITLFNLVNGYRTVVTQRYHGIILAEMLGVPYVSIDHHDKLKGATPTRGTHVPYHGIIKRTVVDAIVSAITQHTMSPFTVPRDTYSQIAENVVSAIRK